MISELFPFKYPINCETLRFVCDKLSLFSFDMFHLLGCFRVRVRYQHYNLIQEASFCHLKLKLFRLLTGIAGSFFVLKGTKKAEQCFFTVPRGGMSGWIMSGLVRLKDRCRLPDTVF